MTLFLSRFPGLARSGCILIFPALCMFFPAGRNALAHSGSTLAHPGRQLALGRVFAINEFVLHAKSITQTGCQSEKV